MKETDLKRKLSERMPNKLADMIVNSKTQANVVLTNEENQEDPLSYDHNELKVYKNNFDLYILLKDMLNTKFKEDSNQTISKKKRTKNEFKSYKKLLTAKLLPTYFADGKQSWSLIENGFDMYRTQIKCIGTDLNDCDFGDPVFLDLQPLSTRLELMCKLIIIIQGACLERSGPPKLVQDRCIQFDADLSPNTNTKNKLSKLKSISCETLLDTTGKYLYV